MKVKKPTRSEVEQQISKCESRIDTLKELGLDNLLPPHKGELSFLKFKLNKIIENDQC